MKIFTYLFAYKKVKALEKRLDNMADMAAQLVIRLDASEQKLARAEADREFFRQGMMNASIAFMESERKMNELRIATNMVA